MPRLGGLDVAHEYAQGRAPDERAADRREAAARALRRPVGLQQARPRDAAALVRLGVGDETRGAPGLEPHVRVEDQHVRLGRRRDEGVLVLRERARPLVDEGAEAERARQLGAPVGHVLAHEPGHAVARERFQAAAQQIALAVRDDERDDAHASASR